MERVLSFAAVGFHGREWTRLVSVALLLLVMATPAVAQAPAPVHDLAAELASAIARSVDPPTPLQLTFATNDTQINADLVSALAARGITVAASSGTAVRVECLANLREWTCSAEIRSATVRRTVTVTSPRFDGSLNAEPLITLETRTIVVRRDQILDVLIVDDALLLLGPRTVERRSRLDPGTPPASATDVQPVAGSRPWPRDLRGRLQRTAAGFEAYLPGVICRGTLAPFAVRCADETEAWPIPVDNLGIVARRNVFTTPEGLAFYNGARIAPPGGASGVMIVVNGQGRLTLLDDRRRPLSSGQVADDVSALRPRCSPDTFVAVSSTGADGFERLRLFRVDGDGLATTPAVWTVPGVLTALWPTPDERAAIAVVYDAAAGRYEAFEVSLSCSR